jgi:plastocyanin
MALGTALFAAMLATLFTTPAQAATVQVTVLGKDGQPLPDAVVSIEPAQARSSQQPQPPPPMQVEIRQQKMRFVPAVTLVPVGSHITFRNLDSWEHHVRGTAAGANSFNTGAPGFEFRLAGKAEGQPEPSAEVTLKDPGPVLLGCHLHGSMRGHVFVTSSPWAMLTDAQGQATWRDVPEGAAQLRLWHPDQLVDAAPQPVTIAPVTALTLPTQITGRRRRL